MKLKHIYPLIPVLFIFAALVMAVLMWFFGAIQLIVDTITILAIFAFIFKIIQLTNE